MPMRAPGGTCVAETRTVKVRVTASAPPAISRTRPGKRVAGSAHRKITTSWPGRRRATLAFRRVHDHVDLAVAREAQHGLPRGHDLPGLGRHRDHDPVGVGGERRVGLLVGGEGGLRARLLRAGLARR